MASAQIRFLYLMCNDVAAVKAFYVDLLGMTAGGFADTKEFGWLCLKCDGFEAMFFRADAKLPVADTFASQPGWQGGTLEVPSWSVLVAEDAFPGIVAKLKAAGAPRFRETPQWCQDSYWGFPVRDPMGNTVEVYTSPKARPASTTWAS